MFGIIFNHLKETRAPRGTDRSPEYKEHFCYKLDSRVNIEDNSILYIQYMSLF